MKTVDLEGIPYPHRFNAASLLIAKANRLAGTLGANEIKPGTHKQLLAAIAYFDMALLLTKPYDPNYATVVNWKCNVLLKLEQYEDAVAWYREIVRISDATDGKAERNATAKLAQEMIAKYSDRKNILLPRGDAPTPSFDDPPYCMRAEEFCALLVERKFKKAHLYLAPALQEKLPIRKLTEAWCSITAEARSESLSVTLQQHMVDWPGRKPDEIGWCYLSVSTDEVSEGVSLVVARTPYNGYWITELEFGRP